MKDKDGWENAAPRRHKKWKQAFFMVKWGSDYEEELLIWPNGEGGCSWAYGIDEGSGSPCDDPEYLSRERIKDEKIFFKGPTRIVPLNYTEKDLYRR